MGYRIALLLGREHLAAALIISCAILPGHALAAVYKCDDHGKVVYSSTKCADNAQVLSTTGAQAGAAVSDHGSLTLYLNAAHAYTTYGTVNDMPVTFVVDTGASMTTISLKTAERAGIKSCFGTGYVATGNGVTRACSVTVRRLSFGGFQLNDVQVIILPALSLDALLGMNVLKGMKINQQDGVMLISN